MWSFIHANCQQCDCSLSDWLWYHAIKDDWRKIEVECCPFSSMYCSKGAIKQVINVRDKKKRYASI